MQKLSTYILLCLLAASTSAPSLSAQQAPPKKEESSVTKKVMVVGVVVLVGAAGCYGLYTWRKSKGEKKYEIPSMDDAVLDDGKDDSNEPYGAYLKPHLAEASQDLV